MMIHEQRRPIPPRSRQQAANTCPRILIRGLMWMMSSHSPRRMIAAEPITDVDTTAADMLEDLDQELNARGIALVFAELKEPVRAKLERYELIGPLDPDHFFPTLEAAVAKGYRGFDPKALVAGTVAQVTERFRELGAMGFTDVIVRHLTTDHAKVLGSFARLGEVRRNLS